MPTTTSRLALPYPVSTDPANVPGDMGNLADALDGGSTVDWDGAAVIISTPGVVGSLPSNPVIGTIYPVNSSPPYLLYYSGDGTATAAAPAGWRIVGGPGTNAALLATAFPGLSAQIGGQPVWARLDHQHATPAWGIASDITADGAHPVAGTSGRIADAAHVHPSANIGAVMLFAGVAIPSNWVLCNGTSYTLSTYPALFGEISYNFGGSGNNFNVPNIPPLTGVPNVSGIPYIIRAS